MLLCFYLLSSGQIAFEEVVAPEDFSVAAIMKSPTGEYFAQATNDFYSIYTSLNGQDWTKRSLPLIHAIEEMQFFSDGTPVLKAAGNEHLVRRNGSWSTMTIPGTSGQVEASFIKDDTLFAFRGATFAYSLDKGKNFTILFTYSDYITNHDAHLWKFKNHLVLHYAVGATDYLAAYTPSGTRVVYKTLNNLSTGNFIFNSCGQVVIHDRETYYILKEQNLQYQYGLMNNIIPGFNSSSYLTSADGYYYARLGSTILKTTGCNFSFDTLVNNTALTQRYTWIGDQEHIILFDRGSDFFVEKPSGSADWNDHTLDINYPSISSVDETYKENQLVTTQNAFFTKAITSDTWIELDTNKNYDIQYSPDGDLYVNKGSELFYSQDNGQNFTNIPLPLMNDPSSTYDLRVLGDDILFLIGGWFEGNYYSVNNGVEWISAGTTTPGLGVLEIKLVEDYIMLAELDYYHSVEKINIYTHEVTNEIIGNYYNIDLYGSAILDDGTIYFQGFDVTNPGEEGLFRYRSETGAEFIGRFDQLDYTTTLLSSGVDLFGFGYDEYYQLEGNALVTHSYTGLPTGYLKKRFYVSTNDHLYVILENNRIFRSTEPLSFARNLTGTIVKDDNGDCQTDITGDPLQYWQVRIESDDYLRIKTTDDNGKFRFSMPEGEFTLSTKPIHDKWQVCESSFPVVINEYLPDVNQDFLARALSTCAKLELDFSTPFLRRCFDNVYSVRVRNTGPEASEGTTLTLRLDPFFSLISASVPFAQIGDSIVKFDLGVLEVNEEVIFHVVFNVSCDAPLGMEHCLAGQLTDDNLCGPDRSSYTECQENIGSFDPNDKRVFNEAGEEVERIDKGQYIYYHIRFQNTGTDTAFNIRIIDPLSPMLDLSTLEMLSASSPYEYFISDGPSLVVSFNKVLLPDSTTNEPASHGFFKFRIKPLPQFDYGTSIFNQAEIYFDFNEPVLTNAAVFVISPAVGTKQAPDFIDFNVFPNPTNRDISLDIPETDMHRIDSYEIIDQLGQTVSQSPFTNSKINVAPLAPGIYNLVLKEKGSVIGARKFVKMK